MKITSKETATKIGRALLKIPITAAYHSRITDAFLFLVVLLIGALLFYQYSVVPQKEEPHVLEGIFLLREGSHNELLQIWQELELKFKAANTKEYPDPFKKTIPVPPEEELTN